MKKRSTNSMSIITNTPAENQMLQEIIEKLKDVPAFEEKKESIQECIDVEKSKEGELVVTIA